MAVAIPTPRSDRFPRWNLHKEGYQWGRDVLKTNWTIFTSIFYDFGESISDWGNWISWLMGFGRCGRTDFVRHVFALNFTLRKWQSIDDLITMDYNLNRVPVEPLQKEFDIGNWLRYIHCFMWVKSYIVCKISSKLYHIWQLLSRAILFLKYMQQFIYCYINHTWYSYYMYLSPQLQTYNTFLEIWSYQRGLQKCCIAL